MPDQYTVKDIKVALKARMYPSVTLWNRLEGRPRTDNFERALAAEVRDPLWMLTRQWQFGEFRADDAGSPIFAKVRVATTLLTRYQGGSGAIEEFDQTLPLETKVERRPLVTDVGAQPVALDIRLSLGRRWLKMVAAIGGYAQAFVDKHGIRAPDPANRDDAAVCAHPEVWQQFKAVAGRAMDGYRFYRYLKPGGGRHPYDGINVLDTHKPDLDAAAKRFVSWCDDFFVVPGDDGDAWHPPRLEYRFACAAPTPDGDKVYVADEYYSGHLDWHSVDIDPAAIGFDAAAAAPDPRSSASRTMLPVSLTYAGMPHPRWWKFEDKKTNFGEVRPDTTDLAKLLFLDFGLVYSNDWFIVPYTLPAGSVVSVEGLVVTNVFGERIWVGAAGRGSDEDWQRWSMFTVNVKGRDLQAADTSLLLLPTVPKVQESAPVEEILMIRDEMANMVWAIEKTIPSPAGMGKRGADAARETLEFQRRWVAASGVASSPIPAAKAPVRYDLMSSVPEHWIPFVSAHGAGSTRQTDLQRASMPRVIEGDAIHAVKPRTTLMREGLDLLTARQYFVAEEEVPRAGIRVTQTYQRTRWTDGRAVLWIGARKQVGRGEASSGLSFDRLTDLPTSR
jgi:hypothetical protein